MASFQYDSNSDIVRLIYEQGEKAQGDSRRPHLGCSAIGRECSREIWYGFRWAGQVMWSGRMLRLFDRGHREEAVLVNALKSIGCEVWEEDPRTNKQFRVKFESGHIKGSADGVCRGLPGDPNTPHLLEFKTHNDKSFKHVKVNGVAASKPQHLVQMFLYMRGLKLTKALYVAVNKNDDELYIEVVEHDASLADEYLEKAKDIVASEVEPEKISQRPDWYKCKFCSFKGQCHFGLPLSMNCRTCDKVEVHDDGEWFCSLDGVKLPDSKQKKGCERWKSI